MNINEVFYKEFTEMMNTRRASMGNNPKFQLVELPIPEMKGVLTGNIGASLCLIKGIHEPFFESLNNEEVLLVGKTSLTKRQPSPEGGFRKDENGRIITLQIPVPHDCVAILSTKNIKMRRFLPNGEEYISSKGFKYVDYYDTSSGVRKFIYIVPRDYVYRLSTCALILTFNTHRAYYRRYKIALQNGNYVYMYVIPYKRSVENASYRILGVKAGYNFNSEVMSIIQLWMQLGVTFNLNITALSDTVKDVNNVGITEGIGPISEGDYVRMNCSLSQEKVENSEAIFNVE